MAHEREYTPSRPLKILLSEGSSTSARQTLYALGPRHTIDVLDPSPLCQCRFSRLVRRWYRCPSFSKQPLVYLRFLANRLRAEKYDVLFPTHEQVYLLARVREQVKRYAGLALPDFEAIHRMQDKANFTRLLEQLGLPHPPTSIVTNRQDLEAACTYPCFIKLAHSTAGTGVFRIDGAANMRQVAQQLETNGLFNDETEILVQQPAVGTLSIIQTVFQHGRLVGAHCAQARRLGVGGAPMARISAWHPQVVQDVARMGRYLNWHGALFLEYFFDDSTGRYQYLEANPRIGETFNATLCGMNLCEQLVRVSTNEKVELLERAPTDALSHQSFMILMAKAIDGGSRSQLVGELFRSWRRQDVYENSEDELTRPTSDLASIIPAAAVVLQLLAAPRTARKLVQRTVSNYSLPESAARTIAKMSDSELFDCFS